MLRWSLCEVKQQFGVLVPGWVTDPVVLHVDGLCMSLMLGCSTFLDLYETYPQYIFRVKLRPKHKPYIWSQMPRQDDRNLDWIHLLNLRGGPQSMFYLNFSLRPAHHLSAYVRTQGFKVQICLNKLAFFTFLLWFCKASHSLLRKFLKIKFWSTKN